MQGYDILMLGVLAFATIRGYFKGLAWQVSSLASIVVSYIVAYRFRDRVASLIDMPDPWRNLIAMLILFVACSAVIWFLFQRIRHFIEKAKLNDFDQQLGAIFGALKGAAWCTVITLFGVSLLRPAMSQEIVDSKSGGYIARILASSKAVIPPQVQEVIQPYLEKAESRLQNRESPADSMVAPETDDVWIPEGSADFLQEFSTSEAEGRRWQ